MLLALAGYIDVIRARRILESVSKFRIREYVCHKHVAQALLPQPPHGFIFGDLSQYDNISTALEGLPAADILAYRRKRYARATGAPLGGV
ncbi:hypothetical protein V3C99_018087 [Haemonchus contortus]|uniref:RNA-dependent RNA polymerase n=1 Tax=Haemonchus contortus TaxID=6289 RepID=A0A7I5EE70_HAECO